ncbi:hypothetical protein HOLleu_20210 [Holothuria leucospilota]|uniref:Uncharacterized protein n=1 Tax=Holothuria leucospilota TaxID=206669 RepID=A0A9Q1C0E4_HOLLE|nr:hypothetical protein HOLleu_20210 [Holothuria leucospilota]
MCIFEVPFQMEPDRGTHLQQKLGSLEAGQDYCSRWTKLLAALEKVIDQTGCVFPPNIAVTDSRLATVDNFRYLGSSISSNVSLDAEINARIGNAATVMSMLQ